MAYQPCSRDIDLRGFFRALEPIERGGDQIFKIARSWSCIVQSIQGLPKEIRWVLATIYNFCSEMMRPGTSEDSYWAMRRWLMYWFEAAETLFTKYDYPIYAPVMDWFSRPSTLSVDGFQLEDCTVVSQSSVSSDGNGTVLHHRSEPSLNKFATHRRHAPYPTGINAWMADQPDWAMTRRQPFEHVPRQRILSQSDPTSQTRPSAYRRGRGSNVFRWNPEATEFYPHMELTTSPVSTTTRSPSRISWDPISGSSTSSVSDGMSRLERGLYSAEDLQFMIEA
ncbi:hypothetical protein E4U42_002678 [Claviceps africana]|uniref:Uncharacterized protein n=1 Tax=Claviceps africana TaxID=83212 RepID=A0A8K0J946_9HYPO|nr:hypothetical protein E4U42_002678 [Claviceps africana]